VSSAGSFGPSAPLSSISTRPGGVGSVRPWPLGVTPEAAHIPGGIRG
jgi:hypothetical protein